MVFTKTETRGKDMTVRSLAIGAMCVLTLVAGACGGSSSSKTPTAGAPKSAATTARTTVPTTTAGATAAGRGAAAHRQPRGTAVDCGAGPAPCPLLAPHTQAPLHPPPPPPPHPA